VREGSRSHLSSERSRLDRGLLAGLRSARSSFPSAMTPPKRRSRTGCLMRLPHVITTPARKELIDKLAAGLNGPVSLVFAGAGAGEAGLCLDELAQSNQGKAGAAFRS